MTIEEQARWEDYKDKLRKVIDSALFNDLGFAPEFKGLGDIVEQNALQLGLLLLANTQPEGLGFNIKIEKVKDCIMYQMVDFTGLLND